ncbi:hypothetical protein [Elizabethkingia anophelis]|uniref:hypothetical protein n=1 Tax=Elizabethkingia anophelis TaxID=1117645 RepID=UPI0038914928
MNGKAKEVFDAWYINKARQRPDIGERYFDENLIAFFENSGDTIKNAHYVEWLDSLGPEFGGWTISDLIYSELNNRNILKATEAAIKKAVEIFNEKYA